MDTTDPAALPRRFRPILVLALGGAALLALRYQLRAHTYHEISGYVAAIPAGALAAATGLTVASYLLLSLYDTMALRYAGAGPTQWQVVFGSLISSAVSHMLGGGLIAGSAVRYRFWSGWGLTGEQISRAVSFIAVTFWLGVLTVSGLALLLDPSLLAGATPAVSALLRLAGSLTLVLVAGYIGLAANGRTAVRFRDWTLPLPEPRRAIAQVLVSCFDWTLAALVLYLLMPEGTGIGFPAFAGVFVLARTAGALSQVPGGFGVFDTIVVLGLRSQSSGQIVGALIAYRAIYYLIPFIAALVSLGVIETLRQRPAISKLVKSFGKWIPKLAPLLLSGLTFLGGVVLLVSGATPSVPSRLQLLNRLLPLALIEAAHLLGSLVGAALIVVAWGLRRRIDAAYYVTLILLGTGAVASLGKGFDVEEALVLALILAVVLPARKLFNRRAALFADPFTPGWIVAVGLVLIGVTLVGEFSYKHIDYADDLWWRFSLRGDAPRFLRASVGAFGLLGIVAITTLAARGAGAGPARRRDAGARLSDLSTLGTAGERPRPDGRQGAPVQRQRAGFPDVRCIGAELDRDG